MLGPRAERAGWDTTHTRLSLLLRSHTSLVRQLPAGSDTQEDSNTHVITVIEHHHQQLLQPKHCSQGESQPVGAPLLLPSHCTGPTFYHFNCQPVVAGMVQLDSHSPEVQLGGKLLTLLEWKVVECVCQPTYRVSAQTCW